MTVKSSVEDIRNRDCTRLKPGYVAGDRGDPLQVRLLNFESSAWRGPHRARFGLPTGRVVQLDIYVLVGRGARRVPSWHECAQGLLGERLDH